MKLWHLGFLILRLLSIKSAAVAECLWLKHAYNNQGKPFKPLLLREAKGEKLFMAPSQDYACTHVCLHIDSLRVRVMSIFDQQIGEQREGQGVSEQSVTISIWRACTCIPSCGQGILKSNEPQNTPKLWQCFVLVWSLLLFSLTLNLKMIVGTIWL